ncbi:MAG: hypothetical protein SVG88_03485 [Halobacteriales archaeon]|nr:hypothetical protein [Halobacteriales archaeon]
MSPLEEGILDIVNEEVGDALRVVAIGTVTDEGRSYSIPYAREDVISEYTESDREAILNDLILEAFHTDKQERLYQAGDLQGTIRVFEETAVLLFLAQAEPNPKGVLVSVEPVAFDRLPAILERGLEYCNRR